MKNHVNKKIGAIAYELSTGDIFTQVNFDHT